VCRVFRGAKCKLATQCNSAPGDVGSRTVTCTDMDSYMSTNTADVVDWRILCALRRDSRESWLDLVGFLEDFRRGSLI
jgi:hypothetical protein